MSAASRLLDRLERATRTGDGQWKARCPAHDDHRPSLSFREADDGRILLYCFAGCGALDVLDALGLDWSDLYPERLAAYPPAAKRRAAPPISARDALELLDEESLVVEIIAQRLARGEPVEQHAANLLLAARRIGAISNAWMAAP